MPARTKKTNDIAFAFALYRALGGVSPESETDITTEQYRFMLQAQTYVEHIYSSLERPITLLAEHLTTFEPDILNNPQNIHLRDISKKRADTTAITYYDPVTHRHFGIATDSPLTASVRMRLPDLLEIFHDFLPECDFSDKIRHIDHEIGLYVESGMTWNDIDKSKLFYRPCADILQNLLEVSFHHGADLARTFIKMFSLESDFYSIYSKKNTYYISGFNIDGHLGLNSEIIPVLETHSDSLHVWQKSDSIIAVELGSDWVFEFRIHNTSTKVTPKSLCFDMSAKKMPDTLLSVITV